MVIQNQIEKMIRNSLVSYQLAESLDLAQGLLSESKKIAAEWTNLDKTTSKTDINRRAMKFIVRIIISALYDAMNLNVTMAKEPVNFDQKEQIDKLAVHFNTELAAEKISDCYRLLEWIESSVNEKLIFEQLLLNLADSDTIHV